MASQLRLTGTGGGNTILNGNDTIAADQTFEFPDDGGTLLTGSTTHDGTGVAPGNALVAGYQQGDWTPTAGVGTIARNNTAWCRVGNLVTVKAQLSSFSGQGNADDITIRGLPYTVGISQAVGSCFYQNVKQGYDTTYISPANGIPLLFFYNTSAAAWDALKYSNLDESHNIYFTATYITNNTDWRPGNGATLDP